MWSTTQSKVKLKDFAGRTIDKHCHGEFYHQTLRKKEANVVHFRDKDDERTVI
jgi:hypothetical protein